MSKDLLTVMRLIDNEETRLDRERSAIEDLLIRECPDINEFERDKFLDQYMNISARILQMKVFRDLFEMEFYHEIKEATKVDMGEKD